MRRRHLYPGGHLRRHRSGRPAPATWWWPPAPSALSTPAGSTPPSSIPAVADFEVTNALVEAARALGKPLHAGRGAVQGQLLRPAQPRAGCPCPMSCSNKWEAWKRLGVKASEMESAALFVVAAALGCRCGSCFHVMWNQEREAAGLDQDMSEDTTAAVRGGRGGPEAPHRRRSVPEGAVSGQGHKTPCGAGGARRASRCGSRIDHYSPTSDSWAM